MTLRARIFGTSDPVAGSRILHARLHPQLRTICAWCGVEVRSGPPTPVSHGCCTVCLERMLAA